MTPGNSPAGEEGLVNHLRMLGASAAGYLGARLQLAGMESREAAAHYAKILAWLIAAFFGLVFGYIFLCLAVVFLIHHFFPSVEWMWILLGVAVVHLAGATIAVLVAKVQFPKAVFTATITEFKKDQTWLNTPPSTTRQS